LAHSIELTKLSKDVSKNLIVLFLPPNITNAHQPSNLGMIAFIMVGYRFIILTLLLAIFDAKGGYKSAGASQRTQPKYIKGLDYGNKAHVLGTMHCASITFQSTGV